MTRITNFGRKRTYLRAGFDGNVDVDDRDEKQEQSQTVESTNSSSNQTKKPRKRRKKTAGNEAGFKQGGGEGDREVSKESNHTDKRSDSRDVTVNEGKKAKSGLKKERMHQKHDRAFLSERRRLNRISDRNAGMTCLRCRQKGHTVKECPNAHNQSELEGSEDGNGNVNSSKSKHAPGVGICYRCGSRRHNLSRCKKNTDPENLLPFASCFVCSKTGHLASTCPQNQGKGIYPNGGSCKLCKQTDHLAKDCPLKSKGDFHMHIARGTDFQFSAEVASKETLMLGDVRTEGAADEDDFHVIKRRRDAVQKEETILKKLGEHKINAPKPKVVQFNK